MPTFTESPDILTEEQTKEDLEQPWHVIVSDDPVNFMGFVTLVFRKVFGYPQAKAEQLMMEVHEKGKSIVWTGLREKAEFYVQQLQAFQLLATMKKAS